MTPGLWPHILFRETLEGGCRGDGMRRGKGFCLGTAELKELMRHIHREVQHRQLDKSPSLRSRLEVKI